MRKAIVPEWTKNCTKKSYKTYFNLQNSVSYKYFQTLFSLYYMYSMNYSHQKKAENTIKKTLSKEALSTSRSFMNEWRIVLSKNKPYQHSIYDAFSFIVYLVHQWCCSTQQHATWNGYQMQFLTFNDINIDTIWLNSTRCDSQTVAFLDIDMMQRNSQQAKCVELNFFL